MFFYARLRYANVALLKIFNITDSNYRKIRESFDLYDTISKPLLLMSENKFQKTYKYTYSGDIISEETI